MKWSRGPDPARGPYVAHARFRMSLSCEQDIHMSHVIAKIEGKKDL